MDRRVKRPATCLLIGILVIAGCSAAPVGSDGTDATPSPTPPETGTPTEEEHHTIEPDERLVISKLIDENVTVSMYEPSGTSNATSTATPEGEELASVTYGPDEKGDIHVTEFEPDGHIVIAIEGEIVWQGLVYPFTYYKLSIDSNGDVRVVEGAVI